MEHMELNGGCKKSRVLIIGASGFLGKELYKTFKADAENYETYGTYAQNTLPYCEHLDITAVESVKSIFQKYHPNIVIITAALTNVDYCEVNKEEAYKINVIGIRHIAEQCKLYGCTAVYVSSEYVFDGNNGPYDENSVPLPINYYGESKLAAEKIVIKELDKYLIARTTVVYGWDTESKNFMMQLIRNLSNNKAMKVPIDQISSPTYCPNLANMIKESCDLNLVGVYNMVGGDVIDRYSFAAKAAKILNLNPNLVLPVETKTLGQVAKRPLRAGLKADKIAALLKNQPLSVVEGCKEIKKYLADK
ncbi:MAG TPA: SDR family oxidoreductase [Methylomusa anaerophila]|uniref:dTDP-4-dehydrorhamnose reductase n=1 Tax=Methylomusa anaerophila TaxID=1930071 RepID=A0A348AH62_9FIRM|nr:SDR family oxidoreductase [Methylomusa anaerophila]BBB90410.1 dTDP-4-dehydrorhamnose reductase [Methylomusa anaerophila]HML90375.1 SDR family oxidoreductase [Methylomusa anaerophila]